MQNMQINLIFLISLLAASINREYEIKLILNNRSSKSSLVPDSFGPVSEPQSAEAFPVGFFRWGNHGEQSGPEQKNLYPRHEFFCSFFVLLYLHLVEVIFSKLKCLLNFSLL